MNAVAATLERLDDYVLVASAVPVFDAHQEPVSEKEAKAKPAWVKKRGDRYVRDFDRAALQEIADNCNRRDERGDPCLFGAGHTVGDQYDDDGRLVRKAKETEQPEPWGVFRNFRVGEVNGKPHLLCDQYAHPDRAEDALTYPRRSVELWLSDRDIDYVALLRRRGKRDLGVVMHQRDGRRGAVLRYEMGDEPAPDPTVNPPDADAPDEETYRSFMKCMKRYEAEQAMPPPAPAPMPAPDAAPPPGGMPPPAPAPFARREVPTQYERRIEALEKQLAASEREKLVMRYERELTALRDEDHYQIDVAEELEDCRDMSPEQFSRRLKQIKRNATPAPVGTAPLRLAPVPGSRQQGPDVINERHQGEALTYMRKHGVEWEEALAKTKGA